MFYTKFGKRVGDGVEKTVKGWHSLLLVLGHPRVLDRHLRTTVYALAIRVLVTLRVKIG